MVKCLCSEDSAAGWPGCHDCGARLQDAQQVTHYELEEGSGGWRELPRVPYGDEMEYMPIERNIPCHDCDAVIGQLHALGCDAETCPNCGGQAFACACRLYLTEQQARIFASRGVLNRV